MKICIQSLTFAYLRGLTYPKEGAGNRRHRIAYRKGETETEIDK